MSASCQKRIRVETFSRATNAFAATNMDSIFSALIHGLLYVLSFGEVLALFASVIGLVLWLAVTILRAL